MDNQTTTVNNNNNHQQSLYKSDNNSLRPNNNQITTSPSTISGSGGSSSGSSKNSHVDHIHQSSSNSPGQNAETAVITTTTTSLNDVQNNINKNKEDILTIIEQDAQETLESDLCCAICQDVYINPLLLNCSHSFCKFCIYSWLTKHKRCPQCRMAVSFQAENLALRNVVQKMILKSSEQFQKIRKTSLEQRLKDEEIQANGDRPTFLKNLASRRLLISDSDFPNRTTEIIFNTADYQAYEDPRIRAQIERELLSGVLGRPNDNSDWEDYNDEHFEDNTDDDDVDDEEDEDEEDDDYSDRDRQSRDETFELDDEELSDSSVDESDSDVYEHEALDDSELEMRTAAMEEDSTDEESEIDLPHRTITVDDDDDDDEDDEDEDEVRYRGPIDDDSNDMIRVLSSDEDTDSDATEIDINFVQDNSLYNNYGGENSSDETDMDTVEMAPYSDDSTIEYVYSDLSQSENEYDYD